MDCFDFDGNTNFLGLEMLPPRSNCCDSDPEGGFQGFSFFGDVLLKGHHEVLKVHLVSEPLSPQLPFSDQFCCCGFRTPDLK